MCVQLPGSSDTAASFEFKKEDHTLGNALRYIIMKKYALLSLSFLPQVSLKSSTLNGLSKRKGEVCLYKHARLLTTYYCSPDVEFCGYSIPHPSEELMNIRIQTYG